MKTPIRKNERVLNLLAYLLGSRRVMPFSEIRASVDGYNDPGTSESTVSRRFERDKEMLRSLGVEILYSDDGATGIQGYMIPKPGAYMGEVELSEREVRLLTVLAAFAGKRSAVFVDNLAGACQKLLAQSAFSEKASGLAAKHLVYPAKATLDRGLSRNLQTLAEALERRRAVTFTYYSIHRDSHTRRTVEPYGLKFFHGEWYLVGKCRQAEAVRIFRLDRIKDSVAVSAPGSAAEYKVPAGFAINDYVGRSPWQLSSKEPATVTLALDAIGAWLVEEACPSGLSVTRRADGAEARCQVRNETGFFKYLISLGKHARITAPTEAVERFKKFVGELGG